MSSNREPVVGLCAKFFHPHAFGVMYLGTIIGHKPEEDIFHVRFIDVEGPRGKTHYWMSREDVSTNSPRRRP